MTYCAIYFANEDEFLSFWKVTPNATPTPSYERWLAAFKSRERQAEMQGVTIVKVKADIDDFLAFCGERDIKPDGSARSSYALHKAGFDS